MIRDSDEKKLNRDLKWAMSFVIAVILFAVIMWLSSCSGEKEIQGRLYACRVKDWIIIDRIYYKDTVMIIERMDRPGFEFFIYRQDAAGVIWPIGSVLPLAILSSFKKSL